MQSTILCCVVDYRNYSILVAHCCIAIIASVWLQHLGIFQIGALPNIPPKQCHPCITGNPKNVYNPISEHPHLANNQQPYLRFLFLIKVDCRLDVGSFSDLWEVNGCRLPSFPA